MLDMAIFVPALGGSSLEYLLPLASRGWACNVESERSRPIDPKHIQALHLPEISWDPISLWPQLAKVRNVMSTYSWWCQESFGFAASASLHSKCRRWLIWLELGISGRGRPHIMNYTMFIIYYYPCLIHLSLLSMRFAVQIQWFSCWGRLFKFVIHRFVQRVEHIKARNGQPWVSRPCLVFLAQTARGGRHCRYAIRPCRAGVMRSTQKMKPGRGWSTPVSSNRSEINRRSSASWQNWKPRTDADLVSWETQVALAT